MAGSIVGVFQAPEPEENGRAVGRLVLGGADRERAEVPATSAAGVVAAQKLEGMATPTARCGSSAARRTATAAAPETMVIFVAPCRTVARPDVFFFLIIWGRRRDGGLSCRGSGGQRPLFGDPCRAAQYSSPEKQWKGVKQAHERKITGPIHAVPPDPGTTSGSCAHHFLGESGFRHAQTPSRQHFVAETASWRPGCRFWLCH